MCPACGKPMVAYEWEGVEIDHCAFCGGTWLDAGEMEMILELAGLSPDGVEEALARAADRQRTRRRCPRCPLKLREIAINEPDPVILDRCPRGHGRCAAESGGNAAGRERRRRDHGRERHG